MATGWWDRVRAQSRFKKVATVFVFFAALADLYVMRHFPSGSGEHDVSQIVWAATMLVWVVALSFEFRGRRAEQDTL